MEMLSPLLDQQPFFERLAATPLQPHLRGLEAAVAARFRAHHSDLPGWLEVLERLPTPAPGGLGLGEPAVRAGTPGDCEAATRERIRALMLELHPWRKGPFDLFGVHIDSEWRSDLKWARLADAIEPLSGRLILDVGCGNGYYGWRMLGAGASLVLGIDPGLRCNLQFHGLRRLLGALPFGVLPLALEDIPHDLGCFDTVFSMGVLYHRRSPLDHLLALKGCLRPDGELVLETLVIDGGEDRVLVPEGRYAQMRNVWFLPSCPTLKGWLKRCGFRDVILRDCSATSTEEQRSTEWMRFHSLGDFLLPGNPTLTVEGMPAPLRAIFTARSG